MAQTLGIKRCWFHKNHYDIPKRRIQEITSKCKLISSKKILKIINMPPELELRMYFLVPYNISPIQQAIQAGHASLEYAREFGDTKLFKDFVDKWKTWIILNGGTTNDGWKEGSQLGTLQQSRGLINDFNLAVSKDQKVLNSVFHEPDLNNALTALCFIVEEPVFNYDDYPDLSSYAKTILDRDEWNECFREYKFSYAEFAIEIPSIYKKWEKIMRGPRNVFLRELLKGKKLA